MRAGMVAGPFSFVFCQLARTPPPVAQARLDRGRRLQIRRQSLSIAG